MNKWINSFSTQAEYEEYIAGDVDQYPNISFVESTNSVYILDEEPAPPAVGLSLVLSFCQDLSDGDWCITQGFCDDSDYFVILMQGDSIVPYDGQYVEYELNGITKQPSLEDPSAGCVWHVNEFTSSITEVNCYDGNGDLIASLNTSC